MAGGPRVVPTLSALYVLEAQHVVRNSRGRAWLMSEDASLSRPPNIISKMEQVPFPFFFLQA